MQTLKNIEEAYNFLVVVLTAAAVAGASLLGSGHGVRFEQLVLVLPLIPGPLGYLSVSNDLMILCICLAEVAVRS